MRNKTLLERLERAAARAVADREPDLRRAWPTEPPRLRFVTDQLPPPHVFRRLPEGVRLQLFVNVMVDFHRRLRHRPEAEQAEVKLEIADSFLPTVAPWVESLDYRKVRAVFDPALLKAREEFIGRRKVYR
jgi:hypothetical protein